MCDGFALVCLKIGPENLRHPFNQSDSNLKLTAPWSPEFSRALPVLHPRSHWPLVVFSFPLICRRDYVSFGFMIINCNKVYQKKIL